MNITQPFFIAFFSAIAGLLIWMTYLYVRKRRLKKRRRRKPLALGLKNTQKNILGRLVSVFGREKVDDVFLAELEETLILADVGVPTCKRLLKVVRNAETPDQAHELLHQEMVSLFTAAPPSVEEVRPQVILVLGVNGVGKTTTIAKLAYRYQSHGKRVLLAAADTFRAAAVEQIEVWGRRLSCKVVAQKSGADAASVAFDAVAKAKAKGYDVVLVDTAGRLHTKHNLMDELKKIDRVVGKASPGAPHERWMVMDATVGHNGLNQAREFNQALDLTGVIVTKLDGTAKGGIVCAVSELGIPVVSLGVGEGMEDLRPFDAKTYVDAILGV
jgi:fused signal recognition particle receptor